MANSFWLGTRPIFHQARTCRLTVVALITVAGSCKLDLGGSARAVVEKPASMNLIGDDNSDRGALMPGGEAPKAQQFSSSAGSSSSDLDLSDLGGLGANSDGTDGCSCPGGTLALQGQRTTCQATVRADEASCGTTPGCVRRCRGLPNCAPDKREAWEVFDGVAWISARGCLAEEVGCACSGGFWLKDAAGGLHCQVSLTSQGVFLSPTLAGSSHGRSACVLDLSQCPDLASQYRDILDQYLDSVTTIPGAEPTATPEKLRCGATLADAINRLCAMRRNLATLNFPGTCLHGPGNTPLRFSVDLTKKQILIH